MARVLGTFWEVVPPATREALLGTLTGRAARDASSPALRAAAAGAVEELLGQVRAAGPRDACHRACPCMPCPTTCPTCLVSLALPPRSLPCPMCDLPSVSPARCALPVSLALSALPTLCDFPYEACRLCLLLRGLSLRPLLPPCVPLPYESAL